MIFDRDTLPLLDEALRTLDGGFDHLPPLSSETDLEPIRAVLLSVAERMADNFPYPHPLYVGQMLKPPHPMARLAYQLATWINPNNHALDGGRCSSAMERETIDHLAGMFGWDTCLGHLCGGGTMANLEALWVARELRPGRAVAASAQAHYTHQRLSSVLSVPFHAVGVDVRGRLDAAALERTLDGHDIGTVVATLGATATGAVDPLPEILTLCGARDVRVHVDAAYGGYFTLAANLDAAARRAFDAIPRADSVVVDPHKHGLQPYGCGCVLFRDPAVGSVYKHDSPYTYFSSDDLHLGEISLECSRAGASAVALWATQQLLPYESGGAFAQSLEACRETALAFHARLAADTRFAPLMRPELDIVVWAVTAETASASSALAQRIFHEAAARDLHLALARMPRRLAGAALPDSAWDADEVTCLRACVMKADQREWLDEIWTRLDAAMSATLRG